VFRKQWDGGMLEDLIGHSLYVMKVKAGLVFHELIHYLYHLVGFNQIGGRSALRNISRLSTPHSWADDRLEEAPNFIRSDFIISRLFNDKWIEVGLQLSSDSRVEGLYDLLKLALA